MVGLVLCAALMLVGGSGSGSVWEELLGETMYRWAEDGQQVEEVSTADVLGSKKTVALYFSASWCRPCQQFTPMLTKFYNEMNKKVRGPRLRSTCM